MKELIEKRNALLAQLEAANKVEMTAEEDAAYRALEDLIEKTEVAIQRAEALATRKARVESEVSSVVNDVPSVTVLREHNCNEHGEYRGYAPIERGGFGEFAFDVKQDAFRRGTSKKLQELRAIQGANTQVGSEGGFLVQTDHADMLFSQAKEESALLSGVKEIVVSGNSNSTTFNQIDETSLASGSMYGGVQAYRIAEGGSFTKSKPSFRKVNVNLEKMGALAYATDEQLEDSSQLNSLLAEAFPKVMAIELAAEILSGDGAMQSLGVLNSGALITVAKESGQAADTVLGLNINNMVDRLLVNDPSKVMWLGHRTIKAQLRTAHLALTNSDKPIYADVSAFGNGQGELAGYRFIESQLCNPLGDLGDIFLLDASMYVMFRKGGVKAASSSHVEFLTDQMVFKWSTRAKGMPMVNNVLTDRNGPGTVSPFVTLAARA